MDASEAEILLDFLSKRQYPEALDKNAKRRLREKAESFIEIDGTLYHNGHNGKRQKVVIGEKEKSDVIGMLHLGLTDGRHYGQNVTIAKISDGYWWRNMTQDIREYCQSCKQCHRSIPNSKLKTKALRTATFHPLHPLSVTGLFHRWAVDFVGPLNETKKGNKYLIVATEYLTRWAEVDALPDKSADRVHQFLIGLVLRFGVCDVLIHDDGQEVSNRLVTELCTKVEMDQTISSAYYPQTHGSSEKFNPALIAQFITHVGKEGSNWDNSIQYLAFAYRTNKQDSTVCTPFEMMFGVKVRLPREFGIHNVLVTDSQKTDLEDAENRKEKLNGTMSVSNEKIKEAPDECVS